jgi:glycine oxidase
MTGPPDVLIIGGGVIGLTTAYYLAKEGVTVLVLDQGDLGRQASWAGAGIIPPGNASRARTSLDWLRARGSEMFPILSHELREQTGADNGYVICGGLEIEDPAEPLPTAAWLEEGISFEEWDADRVRERLPHVGPAVSRSYFLPRMAQVRNPRHLKALMAGCQRLGVHLQPHCEARGLVRAGGKVTGIETDAGPLSAGQYLVAAGAWSDRLLKDAGCTTGVHPVRGQIALLQAETPLRPILLVGKRYVVPRTDGRVLVGSTEEEAGFDARPTAEAIAELLQMATRLVPDLATAAVERCWAGLRPGTPDGSPFLGSVPGYRNLFVATGHYRAGIQQSPATGSLMAQLLTGKKPPISLEDFRPGRPPQVSTATAFRS